MKYIWECGASIVLLQTTVWMLRLPEAEQTNAFQSQSLRKLTLFILFLCSGTRQHLGCGGRGGADVPFSDTEPAVQTEEPGVFVGWWSGEALDGAGQDAPPVWGEAWGGRVPLHRDSTFWRGMAWLCATLQGLSESVHRRCGAGHQPLSHRDELRRLFQAF